MSKEEDQAALAEYKAKIARGERVAGPYDIHPFDLEAETTDRPWTADLWDAIDEYVLISSKITGCEMEDGVKAAAAVEAVVHKIEAGAYADPKPPDGDIERLRSACEAAWALGHKVYHQAATPDAPDWVTTRKLLAEALGKTL